jgi:hemolysin activation/secretion protein
MHQFEPSVCRLALCTLLCFCTSAAFAQGIDSGALQRQQQPTPQERPPDADTRPAPPPVEVQPPPPAASQSDAKIFVSRFKLLEPSPLLDETRLTALLAEFGNRENTMAELDRAMSKVTTELRSRGYAFAQAILPQQEVVDNVVGVQVIPGRLASPGGTPQIEVKGAAARRLEEQRAKDIVANAITDPVALDIRQVERGLLLLNDLPGVRGSGVVIPGSEPGTLGLSLDLSEGPLFGGWLGGDNFGSRSTGVTRVVGDLRINDPTGRGDAGDLYLSHSEGTNSATASYGTPIGLSGLRSRLAMSYMRYELGGELAQLDGKGSSAWVSAGLSYPLRRTRASSVFLTASLDAKRLRDELLGESVSARDSQALSAGVRGNHLFASRPRMLEYSLVLTGGKLDRGGNAKDLAVDQATRRTDGNFAVLRGNGSWQENLGARVTVSASLDVQFANGNLDTSEKMYLGGPRAVRAYPVEEAGSDEGQRLSLEARWRAVQGAQLGGYQGTVLAFFDAGRALRNKETWNGWNSGNPALDNDYLLKGAGLGLSAQFSRHVQIELVAAHKIGSNPGADIQGRDADGRDDDTRYWLNGSFVF